MASLVARVVLLLAIFAGPAEAAVTAADETAFLAKDYTIVGRKGDADAWNKALQAALRRDPGLPAAARDLAPRYGLSPDQMLALDDLWIRFSVFANDMKRLGETATRGRFKAEFVALAQSSGHAPLVMSAAAAALADYDCAPPETFAALVAGMSHEAAWPVVTQVDCPLWRDAYADMAPEKAGVLLAGFARSFDLTSVERLALYAYAASPDFAAHAARGDRDRVRRQFEYLQLDAMIGDGLLDDATALYEALPGPDRAALFADDYDETVDTIDGVTADFHTFSMRRLRQWGSHKPPGAAAADLSLELALAYYGKGDMARARGLARPELLAQGRASLDCWHDSEDVLWKAKCPFHTAVSLDTASFLDQALNRPAQDPYDLFERYGIDSDPNLHVGLFALPHAAVCRYFLNYAPEYAARIYFCSAMPSTRSGGWPAETGSKSPAHALFQKLAARTPALQARIDALAARLDAPPIAPAPAPDASKPAVPRAVKAEPPQPVKLPFRVLPMPAKYRAAPGPLDRTFPLLPEGFTGVRIARSGRRVVVISISQVYEQAGAATGGGYWVHLSDDGGKTWHAPLYTGIIENAPYVAQEDSRMPLIDGDTLNLAAGRRDAPAYFIYPVATVMPDAPKPGLYIHIPLAELVRDSDHDGLTDIAEKRLLLDPHNPDTDGDGIPDGVDPMPNVAQPSVTPEEHKALVPLLQRYFKISIGTAPDPSAATPDVLHPIFIRSDPSQYAGLRPGAMMLVYDEAGMKRRAAMLDDFPIENITPIVFNRAHDRGYVSSGGPGGSETFRVWRDATGTWKATQIGGHYF